LLADHDVDHLNPAFEHKTFFAGEVEHAHHQIKDVASGCSDFGWGILVFISANQQFAMAEMAPRGQCACSFFPHCDGADEILKRDAGADVGESGAWQRLLKELEESRGFEKGVGRHFNGSAARWVTGLKGCFSDADIRKRINRKRSASSGVKVSLVTALCDVLHIVLFYVREDFTVNLKFDFRHTTTVACRFQGISVFGKASRLGFSVTKYLEQLFLGHVVRLSSGLNSVVKEQLSQIVSVFPTRTDVFVGGGEVGLGVGQTSVEGDVVPFHVAASCGDGSRPCCLRFAAT
jgi:hypothetical protein